jgi:hypothetical protein
MRSWREFTNADAPGAEEGTEAQAPLSDTLTTDKKWSPLLSRSSCNEGPV